MNRFTFSLLILIGGILLFFSADEYNKSRLLLKNGITTKAVVIDLEKKYIKRYNNNSGYSYTPIFEYSDLNNNKVKFKSNVKSSSISYQLGDTVEVVYYTEKPNSEKIISSSDLYGIAFVLFFIGIMFFSFGLGAFIYFWKNKTFY